MTPKKSYFSIEEKEKEDDEPISSKNNHIKIAIFHAEQLLYHLQQSKNEEATQKDDII